MTGDSNSNQQQPAKISKVEKLHAVRWQPTVDALKQNTQAKGGNETK